MNKSVRGASLAVGLFAALAGAGAAIAQETGEGVVATQYRGGPRHVGVFAGPAPGNMIDVVWSFDAGNRVIASPIVADGVLYIGARNGLLFARDAASGAARWQFQADAPITATVAVAEGLVFFQTEANTLYALNAADGQERWKRTLGTNMPYVSVDLFPENGNWDFWTSSPLWFGGVVIIGSGDGKVYALDAATGTERWSFATQGRVRTTPATDGTMVYVASFDGHLYALDRETGALRWDFKAAGNPFWPRGDFQSSPVVDGGRVYIGSRDYRLYAVDAATGKEVWRNEHENSWVISTPLVADGRVIVGSSDARLIRAVDAATGAELWTQKTGSNLLSSFIQVEGLAYSGTFAGSVFGINAADGAYGPGTGLEDRVYGIPWIENGVLYIGTNDGLVFALKDGPMPELPQ